MLLAQTTPGGTTIPVTTGPHTAGWLSWFIIGAVALIIGIAWICLRGYRDSSSGE